MAGIKKFLLVLWGLGVIIILLNLFVKSLPTAVNYVGVSSDESDPLSPSSSENLIELKEILNRYSNAKRRVDEVLWGTPGHALKPCWEHRLPPKRAGNTWGFVAVTLSNGPHGHRAQIADAVVVAARLEATLIVPNIKESSQQPHSRFEDVYSLRIFVSSLDGIVRVMGKLPYDLERSDVSITSTPFRVSRDHIEREIRPLFNKQGGFLLLGTFLPPMDENPGDLGDPQMAALRCLAMHESLKPAYLVQRMGDHMIELMREPAPMSSGKRFVAVDLRIDLLREKACNATRASGKRCLETQEVAQFLLKFGYDSDTAIYLTQSRWDPGLRSLLDTFPNVHTKEYSLPFNEESQYVFTGKTQFEQAVDFYICSKSDVFIPTVPELFYSYVTGERILGGLNHIILPSVRLSSRTLDNGMTAEISPYVVKRNHPVFLCVCDYSKYQ